MARAMVMIDATGGSGLDSSGGAGNWKLDSSVQQSFDRNPLNVDVNANPGAGLSRKQAYGNNGGLQLDPIEDISTNVNVGLSGVWNMMLGFTGVLMYLGLNNQSVNITVNLVRAASWAWGVADWIGTTTSVTVYLARAATWYWGLNDWVGWSVNVTVNLVRADAWYWGLND